MQDRRSNRTKTYHPARILVEGSTIYHCTVHNFTPYGVCIELPFEAEELPDKFEFSLDHFQTFYACNTVWREDYVAGVQLRYATTDIAREPACEAPSCSFPCQARGRTKLICFRAYTAALVSRLWIFYDQG